MESFQYNAALQELQNFVWHEFCDHYIEASKNRLYAPGIGWKKTSAQFTIYIILSTITRLYTPFAPHIAEEISISLFRKCAHKHTWPKEQRSLIDEEAEKTWVLLKEVMSSIWKLKSQLKFPLNTEIPEALIGYQTESQRKTLTRVTKDIEEIGKIKHLKFQRSSVLK